MLDKEERREGKIKTRECGSSESNGDYKSIYNSVEAYIRESVDSLCRDGTDTPIVCVH